MWWSDRAIDRVVEELTVLDAIDRLTRVLALRGSPHRLAKNKPSTPSWSLPGRPKSAEYDAPVAPKQDPAVTADAADQPKWMGVRFRKVGYEPQVRSGEEYRRRIEKPFETGQAAIHNGNLLIRRRPDGYDPDKHGDLWIEETHSLQELPGNHPYRHFVTQRLSQKQVGADAVPAPEATPSFPLGDEHQIAVNVDPQHGATGEHDFSSSDGNLYHTHDRMTDALGQLVRGVPLAERKKPLLSKYSPAKPKAGPISHADLHTGVDPLLAGTRLAYHLRMLEREYAGDMPMQHLVRQALAEPTASRYDPETGQPVKGSDAYSQIGEELLARRKDAKNRRMAAVARGDKAAALSEKAAEQKANMLHASYRWDEASKALHLDAATDDLLHSIKKDLTRTGRPTTDADLRQMARVARHLVALRGKKVKTPQEEFERQVELARVQKQYDSDHLARAIFRHLAEASPTKVSVDEVARSILRHTFRNEDRELLKDRTRTIKDLSPFAKKIDASVAAYVDKAIHANSKAKGGVYQKLLGVLNSGKAVERSQDASNQGWGKFWGGLRELAASHRISGKNIERAIRESLERHAAAERGEEKRETIGRQLPWQNVFGLLPGVLGPRTGTHSAERFRRQPVRFGLAETIESFRSVFNSSIFNSWKKAIGSSPADSSAQDAPTEFAPAGDDRELLKNLDLRGQDEDSHRPETSQYQPDPWDDDPPPSTLGLTYGGPFKKHPLPLPSPTDARPVPSSGRPAGLRQANELTPEMRAALDQTEEHQPLPDATQATATSSAPPADPRLSTHLDTRNMTRRQVIDRLKSHGAVVLDPSHPAHRNILDTIHIVGNRYHTVHIRDRRGRRVASYVARNRNVAMDLANRHIELNRLGKQAAAAARQAEPWLDFHEAIAKGLRGNADLSGKVMEHLRSMRDTLGHDLDHRLASRNAPTGRQAVSGQSLPGTGMRLRRGGVPQRLAAEMRSRIRFAAAEQWHADDPEPFQHSSLTPRLNRSLADAHAEVKKNPLSSTAHYEYASHLHDALRMLRTRYRIAIDSQPRSLKVHTLLNDVAERFGWHSRMANATVIGYQRQDPTLEHWLRMISKDSGNQDHRLILADYLEQEKANHDPENAERWADMAQILRLDTEIHQRRSNGEDATPHQEELRRLTSKNEKWAKAKGFSLYPAIAGITKDNPLHYNEWGARRYQLSGEPQRFAESGASVPLHVARTPEFKEWFGDWERDRDNASKVVDEFGLPKVVYHGTRRPDRIGNIFLKSRATSGPMSYFTDDPAIGSNYAVDKRDTSLRMPESYEDWFHFKPRGMRRPVNIAQAWHYLQPEQRATIARLAPRVGVDDDSNITLHGDDHKSGTGGYDWHIKEARGNHLKALVEEWLNSGNLFNSEHEFLNVLEKAGLTGATMNSPHAAYPSIIPAFLSIRKPLVTNRIPQEVMLALKFAAARQRKPPERHGADLWDKRTRDALHWVKTLEDDHAAGKNSHAWTSIPDWVTRVLKKFGYDGIHDTGGKMGGVEHSVYIPFESHQIKSAIANRGGFSSRKKNITMQRFAAKPGQPSDFSQALQRLSSANHLAYIAALRRAYDALGLSPHRMVPVLHDQPGRTQPAMAGAVMNQITPQSAQVAAAWHGLLSRQTGMLSFQAHPQGKDSLYVLHAPGSGEAIRGALDRAGVRQRIMIPKGNGFAVLIHDPGRKMRQQVAAAASELGSTSVGEATGNGSVLGGNDAGEARAKYREVIRGAQQAQPQQMRRAVKYY